MTERKRTHTPRGMAAIPATTTPRPIAPAPKPLLAPVKVVCGRFEHELRHGSALIGRGPECELTVDDEMVSRMHARIQVNSDGVWIEDLYSTNGVYLNGERVVQPQLVHEGDRIFVGSHEVLFVPLPADRASPSTPPLSQRFSGPADPPTYKTPGHSGAPGEIPITARADALDLLGNLARRLANDVKAEQAPKMLGPHLEGILRGASAGLVVPEALGEIASEYAIDLAHWTSDPRWLNYVIELHFVTKRLMSTAMVSALQRSERWVGALDRSLLDYYVGSFTSRSSALDRDEKARLATLRRILKKK